MCIRECMHACVYVCTCISPSVRHLTHPAPYFVSLRFCFWKSRSFTLRFSSSIHFLRSTAPKLMRCSVSMMSASLISLSNLASVWKLGEWFTYSTVNNTPVQSAAHLLSSQQHTCPANNLLFLKLGKLVLHQHPNSGMNSTSF